jgi:hypothetical protein
MKVEFDTTREDGRLERTCKHGVGHTVGHKRGYLLGGYETIHGCDGCCNTYEMQKIKNEPRTRK